METKICQNCKKEFRIEPDDFAFYEKISAPPPTWCPECRMRRRMLFRNEFIMYKHICPLCGKEGVSHFSSNVPFPVYCNECWWSDKWDPANYGRAYDPSKKFFDQWKELSDAVPRPNVEAYQNENSPYSDYTRFSKNVYLSPSTISSDNIGYSKGAWNCRDTFDSMVIQKSESVYEAIDSEHCVNCMWISNCKDCMDSSYLFDCRNAVRCFMSSNLRNKKFVFRNQQLSEEEHYKKIDDIGQDYETHRALVKEYVEMRQHALHRFANMIRCVNSIGDNLFNCKNSKYCFNAAGCEDIKYVVQGSNAKDVQDMYGVGDKPVSLLYDGVNVGYLDSNIYFSSNTFENCARVEYSDYCRTSEDLFGCVGLRKRQYYILNKQYNASEYKELRAKIMDDMIRNPYINLSGLVYAYGEFFPWEFSPFSYNEAMAHFYYPVTKEKARELGYKWHDSEVRDYSPTKFDKDLPETIKEIDDSILSEVIGCAHKQECEHSCTFAFRIVPRELEFYQRMNIPVPRLCPGCRVGERKALRNPIKLWLRTCNCGHQNKYQNTVKHDHGDSPCTNEFETSYAPERPEIVYCEECYLKEVVW